MPAPVMYSTTGSALSSDEIAFAQRVAASFHTSMQQGWIKIVRQIDPATNAVVEYHSDKNIAYVTPGGATDYVGMMMPNPIPYRGVSIGVVDRGTPYVTYENASYGQFGPPFPYTATYVFHNSAGDVVDTATGNTYGRTDGGYSFTNVLYDGTSVIGMLSTFGFNEHTGTEGYMGDRLPSETGKWMLMTGVHLTGGIHPGYSGTNRYEMVDVGYEAILAADQAADTGGRKTYVMTSNGEVLASEVQNTSWQSGSHTYYVPNTIWTGEEAVDMYVDSVSGSPDHQLTFTCPEDCIYPVPASPVEAFNTRRQAWFKTNSDEFIAALKTGFAPGAEGVTRAELQTGEIPETWRFLIKRDVDARYDSYPRDVHNIRVGRHTRRETQYSEAAFSDTVESDTSANLTQAGVKTTTREVTLAYDIVVDGATVTREESFTGYLTQTVVRHNNSDGYQLALSRTDVYDNWYNREATTLPTGSLSTMDAPYLKDRTTSRLGAFLSGTIQTGYNADSTLGVPGSPLTYATSVTPYPAASSALTTTVPDFLKTWHADAEITYAKDGAGASNTLNDSALYGVTEVHISPVGLIADGAGHATAGEPVGIFSADEDGTQVEIYGTAVYTFDWQEGSLTFKKWKPLLDADGNEVASEVVDLPAAWIGNPINCVITYKGLHWPDVIAAIKVRDADAKAGTFTYSDPSWWTIVQALK